MKVAFSFLIFIFLPIVAIAEPDLNKAKEYRAISAENNARILLVPQENDDQFLIYFEGFDSELDGLTKLYQKRNESNNRPEDGSYYQLIGTNRVNLRNHGKETLIHGTVIPYVEVFLPNRPATKMLFVGKADIYMSRKVIKMYDEYQGLAISGVQAKKQNRAAMESLKTNCGLKASLNVDDGTFQSKGAVGVVSAVLSSLEKLCVADEDYRDAVASLTEINVSSPENSGDFYVDSKKSVLYLKLDETTANIKDLSLDQLKKEL